MKINQYRPLKELTLITSVNYDDDGGGGGDDDDDDDDDALVRTGLDDPRYNDIPDITMNMLYPGKSYSKMYGTEPRYNDLRYNDIPDITM